MVAKKSRPKNPKVHNPQIAQLNSEVLDQLIDGYYVLNQDLCYIYMNKSAEQFLSIEKENMMGKKIQEIYPDVFSTTTGKAIQKALKTGKVQQLEMSYAVVNKWLLNTIFPLKNGLAIQVHDISIRKNNENNLLFLAKASKLLSESLNYTKTIQNVAKLAVVSVADWCVVDLLNKKGELEMLAINHNDPKKIALAKEMRQTYPPDKADSSGIYHVIKTGIPLLNAEITDEMIEKTKVSEEQKKIIRKIGFKSTMSVPITSKKTVIGAMTFVTSETHRHYTGADLAMAEDLANRVAAAIENAGLYNDAQAAIQLRNEFISIASHELKTPVTSIKAYGQVLQRRFLKDGDRDAASHLTKMDHQLNKLSILISDLLDVTKIETGKLLLRMENYDFDELTRETVESFQHSITQKIAVSGKSGKTIYGDRERTSQVLINLLSNAAKYSPDSDTIDVILSSTKTSVVVKVRDYGIGIPSDKAAKVFERFYRVSGPEGGTFPGLGLGLYISREIIIRQGGKIWVENNTGSGAEFCFTLPIIM